MSNISPISNVGEDILWRVFCLIANSRPPFQKEYGAPKDEPMENHPLTMIRNVSQVCFEWRQLAVEYPALWGYMIHVPVIGRFSENWRSAIMKRTKEAPLFVYGEVEGEHEATRYFLTNILSQQWIRISEITLYISKCSLFDDHLWTIFWERPAINLIHFETIIFDWAICDPEVMNQNGKTPFTGYAPLLQTFRAFQFYIVPETPWLTGLRELTLGCHLSAAQVLEIISRTPRLEVLDIRTSGDNFTRIKNTPRPVVRLCHARLPNLRYLFIWSTTLQHCSVVLNHISLSQHKYCKVSTQSSNSPTDTEITLEDIESFTQVLIAYTERFVISDKMTELRVSSRRSSFDLDFYRPRGDDIRSRALSCNIGFSNYSVPFPPAFHSHLVKGISSCSLDTVEVLTLLTMEVFPRISFDSADPNFHSFLSALAGVNTLIVTESAMQLLSDVKLNVLSVFPKLSLLAVHTDAKGPSANLARKILLFLSRRVKAGIPVSILEILEPQWHYNEPRKVIRWGFLDFIKGLNVVWTVKGVNHEYVCGSGSPEMLNISYPDEDID